MRKVSLICSVVSAIAMIALVIFVLPDSVPVHYDISGQVDGWGTKWFYVFFGLMPLAIALSYHFYAKNPRPNQKVEDKLIPLLPFVFILIGWMLFPYDPQIQQADLRLLHGIVCVLGVLMIVICNYSGKLHQNRWFGIRTPWTLKNETVWKKTHRLGGFTGTIGGLIMLLGGILGMCLPQLSEIWSFVTLCAGILLVALPPLVYSWWLYHKLEKEGKLE